MSQDPCRASERAVDRAAADTMDELLAELAEREHEFGERLYEIFFEARPDVRPLFGVHAIAEREEMTKETLHSLHAWTEGEPWLRENLIALGKSHWEYGVTADMYDAFVDSMLAGARAVLGGTFDARRERAMREALVAITRPMREAGDAAQAAADARSARAGATKAPQD